MYGICIPSWILRVAVCLPAQGETYSCLKKPIHTTCTYTLVQLTCIICGQLWSMNPDRLLNLYRPATAVHLIVLIIFMIIIDMDSLMMNLCCSTTLQWTSLLEDHSPSLEDQSSLNTLKVIVHTLITMRDFIFKQCHACDLGASYH